MLPISQNTSNSTAKQRQNRKAVEKPLKPVNTYLLEPTEIEKRIVKCKKNIRFLKKLQDKWSKKDIELLLNYYQGRLSYYQSKIDTANAWLVNVSSPKFL